MKNFIYLIMSENDTVEYDVPGRSDYLVLKWSVGEVKSSNAFHFPSSFAEGRNELCRRAKEKGDYLYYVLMDDDVQFINFNLFQFEEVILSYETPPPYVFPYLKAHHFYDSVKEEETYMKYADHPLMAVRSNVALNTPYSKEYDDFCWWRTTTDWNEKYVEKYGVTGICLGWMKIHNGKHRGSYPIGTRNKSYDQAVIPVGGDGTTIRKAIYNPGRNEDVTE